MHILHLIKTSEGAGWALTLMQEIKKKYADVTFSVIVPSGGKHFSQYYEICNSVYELPFSFGPSLIANGFKLRKIIRQENPDIIHSWFTQTTLYARLFLRDFKIPRVFQVVGPLHLENFLFRYMDILSAQSNDYWIATSNYILEKYRNSGIQHKKLFLNFAYADLSKYISDTDTQKKYEYRKSLGIPDGYQIIGTASYIYPPKFWQKSGVKNHELLIEIFSTILKIRNNVILVIAGDTFGDNKSYMKKLKRLAFRTARDRIIFTGKYSDSFAVISNFDAFVYLSKSENLGGVFESLLFEVPTVSSNRGALPELVANGITGFSCDLADKENISERIIEVLNGGDKIEGFKVRGKEKVIKIFKTDAIIKTAYQIYKNILTNSY